MKTKKKRDRKPVSGQLPLTFSLFDIPADAAEVWEACWLRTRGGFYVAAYPSDCISTGGAPIPGVVPPSRLPSTAIVWAASIRTHAVWVNGEETLTAKRDRPMVVRGGAVCDAQNAPGTLFWVLKDAYATIERLCLRATANGLHA